MSLKELFLKARAEVSEDDPRFQDALRDAEESESLARRILDDTLAFAGSLGEDPKWCHKLLMAHARATASLLVTLQRFAAAEGTDLLAVYRDELLPLCCDVAAEEMAAGTCQPSVRSN